MRGTEAVGVAWLLACLLACGSAQPPLRPLSIPEESRCRVEQADALGQALFDALRGPGAPALLADGGTLDAIYASSARGRILQEQALARRRFPGAPWSEVWAGHTYDGVCLQGGQLGGAALGFREPAWVVDRALVVARRGAWRSAAWVSGTFVLTTRGFRTIAIHGVQLPRPSHSDLELAPCDVQRGL